MGDYRVSRSRAPFPGFVVVNTSKPHTETHGPQHAVYQRRPFSAAEWTGLTALLLSVFLWMINPLLSVVPLAGFVLCCLALPFFPRVSFFMPVISRGTTGQNGVSLTFDDGPNPASTPPLLQLLEKHRAHATFFVNGVHVHNNPEILRKIISDGHEVGNHSYTHDDFIMFRGVDRLKEEISCTQQVLEELGCSTRFFRPPVGIVTSRYADALYGTGLITVNFSRRAYDMGNRRIKGLSTRILKNLRAGDIILLHDVPPRKNHDFDLWLAEVEYVLEGIREKGLEPVSLEALIGKE